MKWLPSGIQMSRRWWVASGNIYGPGANFAGADATAVHALISRAVNLRNGEELEVWGDGKAVRSFVFVRDAAGAVLTILASRTVRVDLQRRLRCAGDDRRIGNGGP